MTQAANGAPAGGAPPGGAPAVREASLDDPALRAAWTRLLERAGGETTFFQTPEWHAAWWRGYGGAAGRRPLLLALEREGGLVALAPLMLQRRAAGPLLLWEHVLWMAFDASPYPDLIVAPGGEREAWSAVLAHLTATRPSAWLELRGVYPWSTLRAASLHPTAARDDTPALRLALRADARVDELVRPAFRRNLRRAAALQAGDPSLTWDFATGRDPALEGELERLNRLRFGEASLFADPRGARFFRALCEEAGGRCFFATLRQGGRTAHCIFGFLYGRVLYYFLSGMDPALAALEPGMINFARTFEHAIAAGIERFDFLRGGERYKRDLGGEPSPAERWLLVPPGARARHRLAARLRALKPGARRTRA